jgi:GGDEF domain-containing protein
VLRPADLLFRSGVDELAALLLNTDRKTATTMTARLRSNLATLKANGVLTATGVGLACAPSDAGAADQLLKFARECTVGDEPLSRLPPPEAVH